MYTCIQTFVTQIWEMLPDLFLLWHYPSGITWARGMLCMETGTGCDMGLCNTDTLVQWSFTWRHSSTVSQIWKQGMGGTGRRKRLYLLVWTVHLFSKSILFLIEKLGVLRYYRTTDAEGNVINTFAGLDAYQITTIYHYHNTQILTKTKAKQISKQAKKNY